MKRALLSLLLLAGAPALAQEGKSLRDAEKISLEPTPVERVREELPKLTHSIAPLAKLIAPNKGPVKLAILLVELADCPRPKWEKKSYEAMLFSTGQYSRDPDGRETFGSVHDYYREQSDGQVDLQGKVFDWVTVPAKRAEIETRYWFSLSARRSVLDAALDRLLAREGAHALDAFDALGFIVSGPEAKKYGTVLWPHSSALLHGGKAWRYYLADAGSKEFPTIGVHAHEIGHVLGLPDEYGIQNGGSGIYCLMAVGNAGGWEPSVKADAPRVSPLEAVEKEARSKFSELFPQLGPKKAPPAPEEHEGSELFCLAAHGAPYATAARPLHICAPCKAALGWVKPIAVKPGQRIFLEPIEDHPGEVLALPLSGSKRLLLEYRAKRGYDQGLPRSGLLAWKTADPVSIALETLAFANAALVPAHGVSSVDAAQREGVLWPWKDHTKLALENVRIEGIVEKDGKVFIELK